VFLLGRSSSEESLPGSSGRPLLLCDEVLFAAQHIRGQVLEAESV
jgi:hypothetical protein